MIRVLRHALLAGVTIAAIITGSSGVGQAQDENLRVPGALVVKFAEGVLPAYTSQKSGEGTMGLPGLDAINGQYNLRSYRRLFPTVDDPTPPKIGSPLARYHILTFPPDADLDALAADYLANPDVDDVEFDAYALMYAVPDDPLFPSMWNLSQVSDHDVDADSAWEFVHGSPDIVLGVTDTGVLYDHEDLQDNIWVNPGEDLDHDGAVYDPDDLNGVDDDGNGYVDDLIGWDFVVDGYEPGDFPVIPGEDAEIPDNDPKDFQGHGTHTSGTIAAATNNGAGVSGLAGGFGPGSPGSKIMCLRMGWAINFLGIETGVTKMSYVAEAFVYAADMGARAINYSFGSSQRGGIEVATDYAIAHGVTICAAAGNSNSEFLFGYLQSRPDVITVAATNENDERSYFSNYGSLVDISAPGSNIWSTASTHYAPNYDVKSGTSMAAPHVVGLIGLLLSVNPVLSREELLDIMSITADPTTDYIGEMGAGRINAYKAVLEARSLHISHTPHPNTSDTTNPYLITARIVSEAGLVTDSLSLFYRVEGSGGSFTRVPLSPTGQPDEFSASIPAQSAQTVIEYGLTAEDGAGKQVTSPDSFPAVLYSFEVVGYPALVYFPGSFDVVVEGGHQLTDSLYVRNDGNDDLEFLITVDSTALLAADPATGSVPPGDSATIAVLFDALPVHQDTVLSYVMNLTAKDSIESDIDIPVAMHVQAPDFYVAVEPTSDARLRAAGDTILYAVTLTNFGFVSDHYDLNLSGAQWPTDVWDSSLTGLISQTPTLSPYDEYTIYPRVIIPLGTPFQVSDTLNLTVQSNGDADISGTFSAITTSAGDPDTIPWLDQFQTLDVDTSKWPNNRNVTVSELGLNEPSPPYSLNLNGDPNADDQIATGSIDLSEQVQVVLSYWYQRTGGGDFVEAGDDLIFEFKTDQNEWEEISRQPGGGAAMTEFEHIEIYLPRSAFHADFRLRIRSISSIGPFDDWFVDDVEIYATIPPRVCYDPASFSFNLVQADSTLDTLLVCNEGPGDLRFFLTNTTLTESEQLSGLLGPPPSHDEPPDVVDDQGARLSIPQYPVSMLRQLAGSTQILAWIPYADITQEYANTLNALSLYYTDFTLSETTTLNPAAMESALIGKDVLLIPEQEGASDLFVVGTAMSGVLQTFLAGGGGIVACDGTGGSVSNFLRGAGVLDAAVSEYVNPFTIETAGTHPVTTGIEGSHIAQNGTREIIHTDGQAIMATEGTDHAVVVSKEDGGRVVLFGWDYFNYVDFMARAIANAVQWTSSLVWLSFDPPADTLAAGESTVVALHISTRTIGAGDYHAAFGLHSNDPYTPLVEIPVDAHVRGPEIEVHPTAVVDSVVEGVDKTVSLWVLNLGEEPLQIDSIRSAEFWLNHGHGPLAVAVDDSVEIAVIIGDTDLLPGYHIGTVHIASDDFDEPNVAIPFSIHVGPDPDIWVSPESISVAIDPDDSLHQTLMIGNGGEGTLSYTATIAAVVGASNAYADTKIDPLSDHAQLVRNGDYSLTDPGTIIEDPQPIPSSILVPSPVNGIAFGPDGKLYAAAPGPGVIYRMDAPGLWSEHSTGLDSPQGIAFDLDSNLAAAVQFPYRIQFIHSDGISEVLADLPVAPLGLAYAPAGMLYVTTEGSGIFKVSPDGDVQVFSAGVPTTTHSAAFGPDDRLYVSTWDDGRILAIAGNGTISTYADPGQYTEGLCFDVVGNLYVGNGFTGEILRVNVDRTVDVIGSGYPGPLNLALDEQGLLYIGTAMSNRIDTLRVGVPGIRLPYGSDWIWLTSDNGDVSGLVYTDSLIAQHATVMQVGFSSFFLNAADYYAQIQFASNDPDEDSLTVPVHLHVRSPVAAVSPDTLRIDVSEGQSTDSTLWIVNTGDWGLTVELSTVTPWVTLPPDPPTIAPNDSVSLVVSGDASALISGQYVGAMALATTDPMRRDISVPVLLHVGPDPDLFVTPDTFAFTLVTGDSTDTSLTIANLGLGTLSYRLRTEYTLDPTAVAEAVPYPDWFYEDVAKGATDARTGNPVVQDFGGPDGAGYRWTDSDEPRGPQFDWTDISGSGIQIVGLTDDNFVGPIPIGFDFPYYDSVYSEFYLCSNGYIGFGPTAGYTGLSALPFPSTSDPDNIIAWFWSDLYPYNGANPTRVWMDGDSDRLVIQLDRVRRCCGNTPSITAQVILKPDGEIIVQYNDVEDGFYPEYGGIGIENRLGTVGLGVAFNTPYARDSLALRFARGAKWLSLSPTSGLVATGEQEAVTINVFTDVLAAADYLARIVVESNDPDATSVAIPVTLAVTSPAPPCTSSHQGDMNGDAMINVVDLNMLINALFFGGSDPHDEGCPTSRGDFNANGTLDAVDLNAFIRFAFFTGPGPCNPCDRVSTSCTP